MSILIWLLTFMLVVDCLLLILLVLIQLPKKEAGLGQAFGGGATDALFGAGSGSALTNLTKYTAGAFFALTLLISMLHGHQARAKNKDYRTTLSAAEKLGEIPPAAAKPAPAAAGTALQAPTNTTGSNTLLSLTTNALKAATNAGFTNTSSTAPK